MREASPHSSTNDFSGWVEKQHRTHNLPCWLSYLLWDSRWKFKFSESEFKRYHSVFLHFESANCLLTAGWESLQFK